MTTYKSQSETYKKSGVDIDAGEKLVGKIKTLNPGIGGFAGLFPLNEEQSLVGCTDGVGTKLELSISQKAYKALGQDLVAMSVNDLVVCGAKPLFFLDYYACGKLDTQVAFEVIQGIKEACDLSHCVLLGGETAEMPGFYEGNKFDLAGFAVGLVANQNVVNGKSITPGDVIVGLTSSGFHANGYSLVRHIIKERNLDLNSLLPGTNETLGEALTCPTKLYVDAVMRVMSKVKVKGMAHITGGGLTNIERVLPEGLQYHIPFENIPRPKVVQYMKEMGNIDDNEAYTVWNMGMGFAMIVSPQEVSLVLELLADQNAFVAGKIVKKKRPMKSEAPFFMESLISRRDLSTPKEARDFGYTKGLPSQKIGVHWVTLPTHTQSSLPHAEKCEEEFVYVASGKPVAWLDGYWYQLEPGVALAFPSGTGISHAFFNFEGEPAELVVAGEKTKAENQCYFPLNSERKQLDPAFWWEPTEKPVLGPYPAQMVHPGRDAMKSWKEIPYALDVHSFPSQVRHGSSYPGDNETFSLGVRFNESIPLQMLSIWHEIFEPGQRSSWPHAHKMEEEFCVVLEGQLTLWMEGHTKPLFPGDCVYLAPGTGIHHALYNETDLPAIALVIGQTPKACPEDQLSYFNRNVRNEECKAKGRFWEEVQAARSLHGITIAESFVPPFCISRRNTLVEYASAQEFLHQGGEFLEKHLSEYSLLLGLASAARDGLPNTSQFRYWGTYLNSQLNGLCICSEKGFIVSRMPEPNVFDLVNDLKDKGITSSFVVGPSHTSECFSYYYSQKMGRKSVLSVSQFIFECTEVILPHPAPGQMILAQKEHLDVVADFMLHFYKEASPEQLMTLEQCREAARTKVSSGMAFLWLNLEGIPVTLTCGARPTLEGISIGFVYTPQHQRKHGYASQLVASVSQYYLKEKKFCTLYTDALNPTSNKIYEAIGYQKVATSREYGFRK